MLDEETAGDKAAADRQKTVDRILGRTARKKQGPAGAQALPVNELATLNRIANEIEERERAQRLYIPASEVSAVAGETMAIFADFCADLDNRADPNGELPPATRKRIRELGGELQLRIYREMKDLLDADANAGSSDAQTPRKPARQSRRAPARR